MSLVQLLGWVYLLKYSPLIKVSDLQIKKRTILSDYFDSLKYIAKNPYLISIYITQMIIMILIMTIPILLVRFTQIILKASTIQFAYLEALLSLGIFVGVFFSPVLCRKTNTKFTLILFTAILSFSLFVFSINNNILISYIIYFGIGIRLSSWAVVISEAQLSTNPDFQGRLQATFYSISGIGVLFLYILINYKGNFISIQNFYLVESIVAVLALIFALKINKTELKNHRS